MKSLSARIRGATSELIELGESEEEVVVSTSKLRDMVKAMTGFDIMKSETEFKDIYDILLGIGQVWHDLDDTTRASLGEMLAGKRNSNVLYAILQNVDTMQSAYETALDSESSAMNEFQHYQEGIQFQIDTFKQSVENLANTFMSSDFLKGVISAGTKLVNILDTIIDNLGTIPTLVGAISAAIGSKHNVLFNLASLGLEKNSNVIPLVPNSDLASLASTGSTKQLKALAQEFANLGTEVSKTGLSYDEFLAKVGEGNLDFAVWLDKVGKDAPNQLKNYQKSLVVTTIKTTALRAVTMALQGVLFAFIGFVASKLFEAFDGWIHKNEKLIEVGQEARQAIEDINKSFKEQESLIKDSGKRFAELSQGVDQLTGKNRSLSDEDYQEFLNISKQLAELFPSLTKHYDENGNAIVDLDGNVNTITNSLNSLLEVEKQLARQKFLENIDDVYNGVKASVDKLTEDALKLEDNVNIEEITKALSSIGATNYAVNYVGTGLDSYVDSIQFTDLEFLTRENLDKLAKEYEKQLPEFVRQLNDLYNKAMNEYATLTPYISSQLFDDYAFAKLTPELQAGVQSIINNLDWNSLDLEEDSWTGLMKWIDDNILNALNQNPELQSSFKLSLEAETKFNNNEITVGEYQSYIDNLLPLLENLDDETKKAILITLGIDFDSDGNPINTQKNNLKEQIKKSFGDAYDESQVDLIINELVQSDLEALQDSKIDWSSVLNLNDVTSSVSAIKKEVGKISQQSFEINFDKESISTATKGISKIQSLYQSLYEKMQNGKVGEELAAQFTEIDSLKEELGNVAEYQDIWDEFYDTVTDGSHSFEEMETALNKVLTAYVNATVDLSNFDKAQADAISTQLQLAGVTKESADAYVEAMTELADASQAITDAGYDVENITREEINELVNLGVVSEETAQKLALYNLKKKLANDIVISTSGDITNLLNLANAANVTSESLARLAQIKNSIYKLETTIDSAKERGASEAYLKNMQTILDGYVKDANELASSAQAEITDALTFDNILNANNKASSSSSGGGGSSKESDPWKEAYEKELAALDHLHEMELISDIQYYEEREKLNDKYFKDNEKYTEEYNKNLEEIYKGFQSAYKQYVDDMSDYWEKSLNAGAINFKEYCSQMETMLNSLHDAGKISDQTYHEELEQYYGTVISSYDKAINAAQRVIKKRIEELEKEKDALEKSYDIKKDAIQAQIDSIQSTIDARNDQIDSINDEIEAYQKEIDKINEANEERQAALDMQKALYELNRAENQRTQMVYNSENGFVYQENAQDIKAAQEEIANLEHEQVIRRIEKTISTLEEQVSSLEDEIETLEDEIDGLNDSIDTLEDELDKLLAKYDEQIDGLEKYSDAIGECANAWTEAQEDMVAASIWGSDWQNQILSENMELVKNFEKDYKQAQSNQAEAAKAAANDIVEAYNKQIEALNAWKKAQETSSQTSGTSKLSGGSSVNTSTTPSSGSPTKPKTPTSVGTAKRWNSAVKNKQMTAYGSGTNKARPGYHEIAEDGDEIVLDNYGNAYLAEGHQLHPFEGGEKVFNALETQELLRGKYIPIDSIMPDYSSLLSRVIDNTISNAFTPTNAVLSTRNKSQPMKVDNSITINVGDIHVTEVDNASQIAKAITNQLPNALLQELNRK